MTGGALTRPRFHKEINMSEFPEHLRKQATVKVASAILLVLFFIVAGFILSDIGVM